MELTIFLKRNPQARAHCRHWKNKRISSMSYRLSFSLRLVLALAVALAGFTVRAHAESMHLDNVTETDKKYANFFWKYKTRNRILPGSDPPGDYRFFVPLPERLAGLTYVGHAARLRLVLERARQGERIRVGTLGGSITAGQGVGGNQNTYIQTWVDWLNAAMPPLPGRRTLTQIDPTHIAPGGAGAGGDGGAVAAAAATAAASAAAGGGGGSLLQGLPLNAARDADDDGSDGGGDAARVERQLLRRRQRRALRAADEGEGEEEEALPQEVEEEEAEGQEEAEGEQGEREQHAFINGAIPGTESAYTSSCLYHHLIPDPDLVFVDYAVNDLPTATWTQGGPSRRAMERLIRKLLSLPSKPAVVLVNMFAIGPSKGKYWYSAERDFAEFATYYSLPSVSLKAAVLPSAYVGGTARLSMGGIFTGGLNHPGRGGHVVVAELLITLCLELLRSTPRFAGAEGAAAATATATTPAGDNDGGGGELVAAARGNGSFVGPDTEVSELAAVAARPLPPPMAPGNFETLSKTCYIEEELQSLVQQPVEGWEWTDEGRNKWGYVATELKKKLRMKVSTRLVGERTEEEAAAPIIVQIAFLQSYRGMGTAVVSCVEGCECKPVIVDAYDPREVSLTMMKDVKVTQHPRCVLELISGPPSRAAIVAIKNATQGGGSSGGGGEAEAEAGHKFKLMGLVVGEEPGATSGTVSYFRAEGHQLWKTARGPGRPR